MVSAHVAENSRQGFRPQNPALHQGRARAKSRTALGLRGVVRKKCIRQSYRARYYDPTTGRFLNEDPIRYGEGINFYYYVRNSPSTWNDPSGLIHQAWNEPPFDGRLHDDPGAGLEVLCTKGRNIQRDIAWLEHSIQIRMAEILKLGKDADAGHHDRLDAELATLAHCRSECDKDKKPDPETEPFDVPDTWLIRADIWLYERWEELKRALKRGPQGPGPGPAPGPAPGPGPVPVPVAAP
jgi:RHS repeat-associated protein